MTAAVTAFVLVVSVTGLLCTRFSARTVARHAVAAAAGGLPVAVLLATLGVLR